MRQVSLRLISISDVSDTYVAWLNDPEVTQYLETRFNKQNRNTIRQFIADMGTGGAKLYGIFLDGVQHIGNIKLSPIDPNHKYCTVSYFIGDRAQWGLGYATKAVLLACDFAKKDGARRVQAGCYGANIASQRVLEKAGFEREGVEVMKFKLGDAWDNGVSYAKALE